MMLFSLALLAAAADVPPRPAAGKETFISFASNGGLRDWQAGPDRNIIYVRDRQEQWYRVALTGPCATYPLDTLTYTTDDNGTFDTFSTLRFARYPLTTCGVTSIRASTPPPGRPGARK